MHAIYSDRSFLKHSSFVIAIIVWPKNKLYV